MITLPATSWAQEVNGTRADVVASDAVRVCVSTHRMAWIAPPFETAADAKPTSFASRDQQMAVDRLSLTSGHLAAQACLLSPILALFRHVEITRRSVCFSRAPCRELL